MARERHEKDKQDTKYRHFENIKRHFIKSQTGFYKDLASRTGFFKRVFSNLGYSEQDSQEMAKKLKADVKDSFASEDIVLELDHAETGEVLILYKTRLLDVEVGTTVRHRDQEFVVCLIRENPKQGMVQYRLRQAK